MSRPTILQDYPLLIPYQIDFHTSTTGKHISLTKRHVAYRFGFVHLQSLVSGETGVSCRGLELEIHLIWSIASGKYVIYLNKIPFRQNVVPSRMTSKFEVSFSLPENAFPGSHQIYLKSYATTVGISPQEPQFDLHFDGQRYTNFYRIFEIGGAKMVGHYRATLDDMVDKGVLSSTGGTGRPKAAARVPSHRQMEQSEEKTEEVYSIVGGRSRYKPGMQKTGSQANPGVKRSALIRSESDPGLLENPVLFDNHGLVGGERTNGYNRRNTAPPPASAQNDGSNFGSSGISYSNNTPPQYATSQPQPTMTNNRQSTSRRDVKNSPRNEAPIKEDGSDRDLMNFASEDNQRGSYGIVRSTSSVTMDTMLKNGPDGTIRAENDDVSVAMYSHIDPRQMYKTQQNLSFRLQNPPVYADTSAGDLIQPVYTPSVVDGGNGGMASPNPYVNQNGAHGAPPNHGHLPFSPPQNFQSPPPPTWDTFNMAFANPPAHQTHNIPRR